MYEKYNNYSKRKKFAYESNPIPWKRVSYVKEPENPFSTQKIYREKILIDIFIHSRSKRNPNVSSESCESSKSSGPLNFLVCLM